MRSVVCAMPPPSAASTFRLCRRIACSAPCTTISGGGNSGGSGSPVFCACAAPVANTAPITTAINLTHMTTSLVPVHPACRMNRNHG
jgi:hypothetical protein